MRRHTHDVAALRVGPGRVSRTRQPEQAPPRGTDLRRPPSGHNIRVSRQARGRRIVPRRRDH
ncbi:hypothetical protein GCM10010140_76470 [Streptosporangium pseudovulgare]|uniref:Uncharacterized protein n=1 Tax=Streptosporangium pseudovulgare TaxID=35765 RepID=A0ABQ2RK39_9ACTN|nr:hypothetical protein GCM10010140_76470 [Streptosporangium pseudovulgare]